MKGREGEGRRREGREEEGREGRGGEGEESCAHPFSNSWIRPWYKIIRP